MVLYKCFYCLREIDDSQLKRRVRCPYCGNKILYKPRQMKVVVKAR